MPQPIHDRRLDSPAARRKLSPRREPYWRKIATGCFLGYRRQDQGGSWIARWRDPAGRQHYRALGGAADGLDANGVTLLNFAQAEQAARQWFTTAEALARLGRPTIAYTVADCLADYLDWARERRKSSVHMAATARAAILPSLGALDSGRLSSTDIERWHQALAERPPRHRVVGVDPAEDRRRRRLRANRALSLLRAALNRAWRAGSIVGGSDAWLRVEPFPGVETCRLNVLDTEQARRLVAACPPDLGRLVKLALVTGARYGELAAFRVGDVEPLSGTLLVSDSKSGKPRRIILASEALALCHTLTAGRPSDAPLLLKADGTAWLRDHHIRPFRRAATAAGLPLTFHELRHTWASLAIMNGMALPVVAQMLGHGDTRMVERHYGHLAPNYVATQVRERAPQFDFLAA